MYMYRSNQRLVHIGYTPVSVGQIACVTRTVLLTRQQHWKGIYSHETEHFYIEH
jgi:hypothetical protein